MTEIHPSFNGGEGRGKGYVKRVDQLFRTEDNTLVAWVTGNERYATSARIDEASRTIS